MAGIKNLEALAGAIAQNLSFSRRSFFPKTFHMLFAQDPQKVPSPTVPPKKETELRTTYASQLASKDKSVVDTLLKDALETKGDPAEQFQLFTFTYQKASELLDFPNVAKVVDEMDKRYSDINPTGLRSRALDNARKKKPKGEQLDALVNGDLEFAIYEFSLGQKNTAHYDEATKGAKNAIDGAKALKNKPLEDKATAIQTYSTDLSNNKDAAFTQAKFNYFILGDTASEAVLTALSNGPDAKLKKMAGLQSVGGKAPENYYEYGDAAYDAANDSGRLSFEKANLQSVALNLYNLVTSTAEATPAAKKKYGMDKKLKDRKAELETKLAQYGGSAPGTDLLRMIDLSKDKAMGDCTLNGNVLSTEKKPVFSIVKLPYAPPPQYDLIVTLEPKDGDETLYLGLMKDKVKFNVQIDGYSAMCLTGVELLNGQNLIKNDAAHKGKLLVKNKPNTIICAVRDGGVTISVNDKKVSEYKGNFQNVGERGDYAPTAHNGLYLAVHNLAMNITKIQVVPISGQGKMLR